MFVRRDGRDDSGTTYAEKFELLLDMFPHPDRVAADRKKRRWRGREIERITRRRVSASYVSALRKGKIEKPGTNQLQLLAIVMGFPYELWTTEPDRWEEIIRENPQPGLQALDFAGSHLSERLERCFQRTYNVRTGRNPTNAEVAHASDGVLTETEVKAIREGSLTNPSVTQIIALSDFFNEPLSYWTDPLALLLEEAREEKSKTQAREKAVRDIKQERLLEEASNLDETDLDTVLRLVRELNALKTGQQKER